ncbi:MAG: efflux RND transporter periplasmic adaptor subunit [Pseudobdellovibrionaceae bacterium]
MISYEKNKKIFISVFGVLLLLAAFLLWKQVFNRQEKIKPKQGDVVESIYGLGTVTTDKIFHVRAGMTLSVQKLFVKEGDAVQSKDPLVKLDEHTMTSTIEGTVTNVSYKEGELVPPQMTVVTVTNLQHLFLEVSLEQQSILRIKKDQDVFISFESLRNEKYQGQVYSIYPRDNQFIVRIELKNWPTGVLPGMTADVAILVGKKNNVLLLPLRSIVAGQVIRIRNGKKEKIPIKLGVIDGEWGEVTSENILSDDELLTRK